MHLQNYITLEYFNNFHYSNNKKSFSKKNIQGYFKDRFITIIIFYVEEFYLTMGGILLKN